MPWRSVLFGLAAAAAALLIVGPPASARAPVADPTVPAKHDADPVNDEVRDLKPQPVQEFMEEVVLHHVALATGMASLALAS